MFSVRKSGSWWLRVAVEDVGIGPGQGDEGVRDDILCHFLCRKQHSRRTASRVPTVELLKFSSVRFRHPKTPTKSPPASGVLRPTGSLLGGCLPFAGMVLIGPRPEGASKVRRCSLCGPMFGLKISSSIRPELNFRAHPSSDRQRTGWRRRDRGLHETLFLGGADGSALPTLVEAAGRASWWMPGFGCSGTATSSPPGAAEGRTLDARSGHRPHRPHRGPSLVHLAARPCRSSPARPPCR